MCGEEESHETAGVESWQETVVVLAVEGKGFGWDTVCVCGGHSRLDRERRLGHHSRTPQQQWVMVKDPRLARCFGVNRGNSKGEWTSDAVLSEAWEVV